MTKKKHYRTRELSGNNSITLFSMNPVDEIQDSCKMSKVTVRV